MNSPGSPRDQDLSALIPLLLVAAVGLLAAFLLPLLFAVLPPRLLDPSWQLQISTLLLRWAFLPLLALVLVHLAVVLDPLAHPWRDRLSAWAVPVSFGFLLLIPLQLVASSQLGLDVSSSGTAAASAPQQRLQAHRQAILAATSITDLRARLQALNSPPLPALVFQQTLPEVRQQLLGSLDRAESRLAASPLPDPSKGQVIRLGLNGLRGVLEAFIYAICYAVAARRPRAAGSLLDDWWWLWERFRLSWRRDGQDPRATVGRRSFADASYFEQLGQEHVKPTDSPESR